MYVTLFIDMQKLMDYTKLSHNEPQQSATSHNEQQPSTKTHKEPQRNTTSHNQPQRATTSHNVSQRLTTTTLKIAQFNFMDTLCVIHNKIIISCFYGFLFLIFNALLFSFVKLKFYTHHSSCPPPDLAKIKASSKNTTKLRLLSKKSKIVKQFTFSPQIFITC